jgi:hypothetical protein
MMHQSYTLPESIVFRTPSLLNQGRFSLMKSIFIIDGHNVPRTGRCDNMTYGVVSPVFGTEYQDEAAHVGVYSPYLNMTLTVGHITASECVLNIAPLFCIQFIKLGTPAMDNQRLYSPELESEGPAGLRSGMSLAELFKNIREWSFMVEEPFNLNHPMATYSKLVIDTLLPPQEILDEIDAMPDMHLARFLKGDENHRDHIDGFPQMSEEMIAWFKTKLEQFPNKTTSEYLEELTI